MRKVCLDCAGDGVCRSLIIAQVGQCLCVVLPPLETRLITLEMKYSS